jgi:hypothetical protein
MPRPGVRSTVSKVGRFGHRDLSVPQGLHCPGWFSSAPLAVTNALPALPPLETTTNSAAEGLPTKDSASTPPPQQQKQLFHRRLQPVEILTSAGDWVAGYFVHSCIVVTNLIGIEQKFTLFDADGGGLIPFWGRFVRSS